MNSGTPRRPGDDISGLSRHGGDIYALARRMKRSPEDFIDFSSNTHIFAADITGSLVRATPYPFEHYPDTDCSGLRDVIAEHEGVDPDRIIAGNGSSELIWLTMLALAPRRVLLIGPMFSEYARVCKAFEIPYDIITPPASQDFICGATELRAMWGSTADLAILCTPNNPAAVTYPNIHDMLDVLRVPRLLIDNTYREFLWGEAEYEENNWIRYQKQIRPGVAIFSMNSATKFFVCPGIRLGYMVAESKQLRRLTQVRPPWSVSPFAQLMGMQFFGRIDEYRERLAPMRHERMDLARRLRRLSCFDPDTVFEGPSFITAGLQGGLSAQTVQQALLKRNIIVRDCDTIPGMPKGFIRMQARSAQDNDALASALEWYADHG